MLTSNHKKLLIALIAPIIFFTACRFFQKENASDGEIDLPKQTAPFSTKEPDNFETEILVSAFIDGAGSEKKYFLAVRNGASYRSFDHGEKNETAILEKADGERFLLNMSTKTYRRAAQSAATADSGDLRHFLTTKWLNEKKGAKFEDLGTEEGLKKYRVTIEDKKGSEILVFFDEKLQIPVKQEFYSVNSEKETLSYSIELKNTKTQADAKYFEIPAGYKPETETETEQEKKQ
ncbi:MAG: hypothetical protein R2681_13205 [Pyrinomonadaceae bacterium]